MKNIKFNTREVLKNIPAVDHIVLYCYKNIDVPFHYSLLKKIIKSEIKLLKSKILNGDEIINVKKLLYESIFSKITLMSKNSLKSLVNGTGIVLHTGLGRAPISKTVLKNTINSIYPYSNLEFNVKNNSRGERNSHISYLINSIINSEDSIIVNNNAAAVLLVLNTLSNNKDVIISRGELVEIGGSFRIPDVIEKANCKMIEIGATNKTHLKDFKNAINNNTGLIMIAHTSNYKVVGFTESVEIRDIVKLANKKKIPVFLDLGSGAIINYEKYGLPKENLVQEYIKMGIDIISFSGDKLIGGIQSGIICGKKRLINKLHKNSMYRALRCDKISISLTENILKTYINNEAVNKDNLTFSLLVRKRNELRKIGERILKNIGIKIIKKYRIELIESNVQAGSGSLPIENIESLALIFSNNELKPTEISQRFRSPNVPVIGYIKGNKFHIDLKAIPNNQIDFLIGTIKDCLQ